jgi:predicted nucleotidyltransferase
VNGWDLAKALRLLAKGNATVTEWLRSPIVYSGSESFHDELLRLAASVYDPVRAGRHYLHVGRRQLDRYAETISLKRVFYSLRPAATLRWLRVNPRGVPPMDLPSLMAECGPDPVVEAETAALIALKATAREAGAAEVPDAVLAFIRDELALGTEAYEHADVRATAESIELCTRFFLHALEEYGD